MTSSADVAGREDISEASQDRRRQATSAHRQLQAFTRGGSSGCAGLPSQLGPWGAPPGAGLPPVQEREHGTICAAPLISVHPVAQRALVDAQIPGHPSNRLAGFPYQASRDLPEVAVELLV